MGSLGGYKLSGLLIKRCGRPERLDSDPGGPKLVKELTVFARHGHALIIEKHQVLRVICSDALQFTKVELRQMFWAGCIRIL